MGGLVAGRLELEGSFNFRDLGGWRTEDGRSVASGRLYRADGVHLLSEGDVSRMHDEVGLRTLIDLRSDLEIQVAGVGLLAEGGVPRLHYPLTSRPRDGAVVDGAVLNSGAAPSSDRSPDALVAQYMGMLEVSSEHMVDAVSNLARYETLPAVFFCAAGKDRTGVLSALVLGAVGVRDEDIVEDYVLTGESIELIIGRFAATPGSPAMYRELPASHFMPHAETMGRVIAGVRERYGSFSDYLLRMGLSPGALASLRTSLLDG